jgi:hypothetical protein
MKTSKVCIISEPVIINKKMFLIVFMIIKWERKNTIHANVNYGLLDDDAV